MSKISTWAGAVVLELLPVAAMAHHSAAQYDFSQIAPLRYGADGGCMQAFVLGDGTQF